MFKTKAGATYSIHTPQPGGTQQQQQVLAPPKAPSHFRLETLNVSFQDGPRWNDLNGHPQTDARHQLIVDLVERSEADVVCLQEATGMLRAPELGGGTSGISGGGAYKYIRSRYAARAHCPGETVLYVNQDTCSIIKEAHCAPTATGAASSESGTQLTTPTFPIVCIQQKRAGGGGGGAGGGSRFILIASVHMFPSAGQVNEKVRAVHMVSVVQSMRRCAREWKLPPQNTVCFVAGDTNMQTHEEPPVELGLIDLWLANVLPKYQALKKKGGNNNNNNNVAVDDAEYDDDDFDDDGQDTSWFFNRFARQRYTIESARSSSAPPIKFFEDSATFADKFNDFNFESIVAMRKKYATPKMLRYDRVFMFMLNATVEEAKQAEKQHSSSSSNKAQQPPPIRVVDAIRFFDHRVVVHSGPGAAGRGGGGGGGARDDAATIKVRGEEVASLPGRTLSDHYGLLYTFEM